MTAQPAVENCYSVSFTVMSKVRGPAAAVLALVENLRESLDEGRLPSWVTEDDIEWSVFVPDEDDE